MADGIGVGYIIVRNRSDRQQQRRILREEIRVVHAGADAKRRANAGIRDMVRGILFRD